MIKRVLVTGANGFIGSVLCQHLLTEGFEVIAALRHGQTSFSLQDVPSVLVGQINGQTDWTEAVTGVDAIVHLAARVHVMADKAHDSLSLYRQINVAGTRNLAKHAIQAGVKRFVYLSSVKVNGEENTESYSEGDELSPEDDYGISKMEAEMQLKATIEQSNMDYVVLRPPLVYGPGVKANFLSLMKLVDRKIPLPLGSITNRRSFIFLDNLVDCILECITHPKAANQTYLVSDGHDLSTAELIRLMAKALNTRCYLLPFPHSSLRTIARLCGKEGVAKRLLDSLSVDISKIKDDLEWTPPFAVDYGLRDTAKWFKSKNLLKNSSGC